MVYVYMAETGNLPDPKDVPECMAGLTEERKQKILRYRHAEDRKESLGAGLLMQKILGRFGISAEDVFIRENGKPEVEGIYFNLSHSHGMVVCAVSKLAVGCDIEKVAKPRMNIAGKVFAESEKMYLAQFEGERLAREFYRIWTMKESYVKMTGEGIRFPLTQVEFVIGDTVEVYRDGSRVPCLINEYEVEGYKLTVCSEEADAAELEWIELA